MSAGNIQQFGTPADIYEQPANRLVVDIIGESIPLDSQVITAGEQTVSVQQQAGDVIDAHTVQ